MAITYTSREQIDVYRFPLPVAVGIPLVAIFLQSFLPVHFHFFYLFDLPLLVTIFFALARRNPVSGLLTGGVIGMLQDSLTHQPIGIYGIAKTVIGYGASSLGVKLDVENSGSRFLVTFGFYLLHDLVYFAVARGLVNFDATELPGLLGRSTRDLAKELGAAYSREVVHRDDLVLLRR